jgi:hypothetical protein
MILRGSITKPVRVRQRQVLASAQGRPDEARVVAGVVPRIEVWRKAQCVLGLRVCLLPAPIPVPAFVELRQGSNDICLHLRASLEGASTSAFSYLAYATAVRLVRTPIPAEDSSLEAKHDRDRLSADKPLYTSHPSRPLFPLAADNLEGHIAPQIVGESQG